MHFTFSNLEGRKGGVIKKNFFRRTQETTALIFMSQSFEAFSGKSCACFFSVLITRGGDIEAMRGTDGG